jgi:hypothetical protein
MSFVAVPGNNYARHPAPTPEQTALARGYTAAEIGGENPYMSGTPEHESFEFAYAKGREYKEAKAANGGRIPEGW